MAVTGPRGAGHPAGAARGLLRRGPAWVALAATLVCACGRGPGPATSSPAPDRTGSPAAASASVPATGTSPTPAVSAAGPHLDTAYCGRVDTTIPGAAAVIDHDGTLETPLTPVQTVWFEMASTMVPACSEITPHPPAVLSRNLTDGALSNAAFQTWIQEDEEFWTLFEWGQRHGQAAFLQYLLDNGSNNAVSFVLSGGTVVDTPACEYLEQVDAVHVSGSEMEALIGSSVSAPGNVFVGASMGPCTSTWTTSDGTITRHVLSAGQAAAEVDVTVTAQNAALGQYLRYEASLVRGDNPTADDIMAQVGIPGA